MQNWQRGAAVSRSGYITTLQWIQGKRPADLERLLGYGHGTLSRGWWLLFLKQRPKKDEFRLRGVTLFEDGRRPGEELQIEEQIRKMAETRGRPSLNLDGSDYERVGLKERLSSSFNLQGAQRLAKVVPMGSATFTKGDAGVGQWELVKPLLFEVITFVEPGERAFYDNVARQFISKA